METHDVKLVVTWESYKWYMIIPVPNNRDEEEYLIEFLEAFLHPSVFKYGDWDFAD